MKGVGKFGEVMAGEKGKVSYDEVAARLEKIIHSGSQRKPITDFVCRELRKIPHYTWVGIYNVDGSELVLASWSGPSATLHLRIPIGEGICGAAVKDKATVIVPDVNDDPRYLQCFINTRAEMVVPILRDGAAIAEIDIDSDQLNAFTPTDKEFVEWVAAELLRILEDRASQAELAPDANERVNLVRRRQFVRGHEAGDGLRVDDAVLALGPVGVFDEPRGLHLLQMMGERRRRDGHLFEDLLVGRPLPFHEEVNHLQGYRLPQEREDLLLRLREGGPELRLTRRRSRIEALVLSVHRGRDQLVLLEEPEMVVRQGDGQVQGSR